MSPHGGLKFKKVKKTIFIPPDQYPAIHDNKISTNKAY